MPADSTLKHCDSFAFYGTDETLMTDFGYEMTAGVSVSASGGRYSSGPSVLMDNGASAAYLRLPLSASTLNSAFSSPMTAGQTLAIAFNVYLDHASTDGEIIVGASDDGADVAVTFDFSTDTITIEGNNTDTQAFSGAAITLTKATWYQIEVWLHKTASSDGDFARVFLDGVEVASATTVDSDSTDMDHAYIGHGANSEDITISDLILRLNPANPIAGGTLRVEAVPYDAAPAAGPTDGTRTGGANDYDVMSDQDDATYFSLEAGDIRTWQTSDLAGITDNIKGIGIKSRAKLSIAGSKSMQPVIYSGATKTSLGTAHTVTDAVNEQTFAQVVASDPRSGPTDWTAANINGEDAGVEIS